MKKIIFAAASLLMMASCASNGAKSAEEYQDKVNAMMEEYSLAMNTISSDETLSPEEASAKMVAQEEETTKALIDYSVATIKRNSKDTLAVEVLQEVYYMMELEELESTINAISPAMREHPVVQKISQSVDAKKATKVGMMFTDFEIDGVKFSDFVGCGKYVLVDFWASWCGPCKREIPNIKHVYETYAGEKFDILSIAVWDKPEDTVRAAESLGIVWNQIINAQQVPTDIYGIDGIPHIMLIGPDGIIVARDLRGEAIEAAVKEALAL